MLEEIVRLSAMQSCIFFLFFTFLYSTLRYGSWSRWEQGEEPDARKQMITVPSISEARSFSAKWTLNTLQKNVDTDSVATVMNMDDQGNLI